MQTSAKYCLIDIVRRVLVVHGIEMRLIVEVWQYNVYV